MNFPHSRPLPQGWSEHFDTERGIWYYIDLDSIPPRTSLVHPADRHDLSASRPLPTITDSVIGDNCDNVQINGAMTNTYAQWLYATAMASNFSSQPSISIPEVSTGQHAPIPSYSIADEDVSLPPTQASSPLPPTPETTKLEPECSQPRSRRLNRASFPMGLPIAIPFSVTEGSTRQSLYNPVVQTSTSLPTCDSRLRLKPQYDTLQGPEPVRDSSVRTSHIELDSRTKALPSCLADGNDLMTFPAVSNDQRINLYSAITEDNMFLMPTQGRVASAEQHAILLDEVPLPSVPPTQSGLQQPITSPSFSRSTKQIIFQPRPIKPIQRLSASFQDQIRETSIPTPSFNEDQPDVVSGRTRTTTLFSRFSIGYS